MSDHPMNPQTASREEAPPASAQESWLTPTTHLKRFGDAMALLCRGNRPSDEILLAWLDRDVDDLRLQEFACEHGPAWAQGIGLIDAAQLAAEQPTEGVDHEFLPSREEAPAALSAQAPFAYYVYIPAEQRGELVHDLDEATDDLTNCECEVTKLYATPSEALSPATVAQPVYEVAALIKERDGWQEHAKWLQHRLHLTQCDNTLLRSHASKDIWVWQGDGTDHLESMGKRMVVAIFAGDLRTAIEAAQPCASQGCGGAELRQAAEEAIQWLNSWFRNHDGNKVADKLRAALSKNN